jgi:hypothetical protein
MAPLRSLLVLLILIGLYFAATAVAQAPVEWYSGGGVAAGTAPTSPDYKGGGALAPSLGGTATTPAPTPNLPPPTEVPKQDVSPPAEAARAAKAPSTQAEATRAPAASAAAAPTAAQPAASSGGLPFTGLELLAVVGAGLCLLLAGLALRPRPARR